MIASYYVSIYMMSHIYILYKVLVHRAPRRALCATCLSGLPSGPRALAIAAAGSRLCEPRAYFLVFAIVIGLTGIAWSFCATWL